MCVCCGIQKLFLKRKLYPVHWLGMLIVMAGLVLVGCSSVFRANHNGSTSHTLLGQYCRGLLLCWCHTQFCALHVLPNCHFKHVLLGIWVLLTMPGLCVMQAPSLSFTCSFSHSHAHTCMQAHMHTHTGTHACTHSCMHKHRRMHTHARTHTCTHILLGWCFIHTAKSVFTACCCMCPMWLILPLASQSPTPRPRRGRWKQACWLMGLWWSWDWLSRPAVDKHLLRTTQGDTDGLTTMENDTAR